jgi:hypothetical protein
MNTKEAESFVLAASEVFKIMLSCPIERRELSLKGSDVPTFPVSGVLTLSGDSRGMLILSLSQEVAMKTLSARWPRLPLVGKDPRRGAKRLARRRRGVARSTPPASTAGRRRRGVWSCSRRSRRPDTSRGRRSWRAPSAR